MVRDFAVQVFKFSFSTLMNKTTTIYFCQLGTDELNIDKYKLMV